MARGAKPTAQTTVTKRRACVFCGCSDCKITKEHAWPNWMRALFPPEPTTITSTRKQRGSDLPISYHPESDDMGVKANSVCKYTCNSGWMNRLERSVQPFLEPMIQSGTATVLSPEQCHVLALWGCKTAMVFEFTTDVPPFFTFAERNTLRLTQRLPLPRLAFLVSIARYSGFRYMSTFWATKIVFNTMANGDLLSLDGYHATISAGQFVLQLTAVRTAIEMAGIWLPINPKWADFVSYVWPDEHQSIAWPRKSALDDGMLDEFLRYEIVS